MPVGFPDYYGGLTLPVTVPEGGTGQTSITANALLYGQGTSKLLETNVGASGQILQINSSTLLPTFQDIDISGGGITGIVPIANGGTGSSAPALTAGTNIAITGTWPDNTISLADPMTVNLVLKTSGSTGLTLQSTAADSVSIDFQNTAHIYSLGYYLGALSQFSLYDGTRTAYPLAIDDSGNLILENPLATAYGGTGTTAPAMTAGTNIALSGSFPNYTIALQSPLTPDITISGSGNVALHIETSSVGSAYIELKGTDHDWQFGEYAGGLGGLNVYDATNSLVAFGITDSDTVWIANTINHYNGQYTAGGGVPSILASGTKTGIASDQTIASITAPATGQYRVSIYTIVTSAATGQIEFQPQFYDPFLGAYYQLPVILISNPAVGAVQSGDWTFYAESGKNIDILAIGATSPTPTVSVAYTIERL